MKRQRHGFTLVELLVVIAIIGILAGLLLPAVGVMMENMRRNQCMNRIRQLGIGTHAYQNKHGELPGFIDDYGVYIPPGGSIPPDPSDPGNTSAFPAHIKLGGFGVALLPEIDQQATWEHWSTNKYPVLYPGGGSYNNTIEEAGAGYHALAAPNISTFLCPSATIYASNFGQNNFIPNTGMSHLRFGFSDVLTRLDRSYNKRNAVFNLKYIGVNLPAPDPPNGVPAGMQIGGKMTLEDIKDGKGQTILFSENLQAFPWFRPGWLDGADLTNITAAGDLDVSASSVAGPPIWDLLIRGRFTNGMVWHFEDDLNVPNTNPNVLSPSAQVSNVTPIHKINGGGVQSESNRVRRMQFNDCMEMARPSSNHPGGVNAVFADGSTKFLTDTMDYRVYQAIHTPEGKKSDVPFKEFVLTDQLPD